MEIEIDSKWLPIYEALASEVRINMIHLLANRPMNVKELAGATGLSSAIMSMHVKKLEKAGIIRSEIKRQQGSTQKICTLAMESLVVTFPNKQQIVKQSHVMRIPIGHYTDFQIRPTCGLATREKLIGQFDDPRYFLDAERVDAAILWFGQGYVEYKVPNYLLSSQQPEELSISLELGSEAPGTNPNWPSDITFFLNEVHLGSWTSPGDFGGRGSYTPEWWEEHLNQFGMLKVIRVTDKGTYLDGQLLSGVTLDQLHITEKQWTFRIAVLPDAAHVGGATLFGKGFGNYDQDIVMKLYYNKSL